MRRKLFQLATAALALTCAAAMALWVISYLFPIYSKPPAAAITAVPGTAFKGGIGLDQGSIRYVTWHAGPFEITGETRRFPIRLSAVVAVSGVLAGFMLLWPSFLRLHSQRMARARLLAGGCASCGYSLAGNTSGICPECGTPVAEKAGAKA